MSIEDDAIKYPGAVPLGQILPSGRQPTTKLDNTVVSRKKAVHSPLHKPAKYFNHKIVQSGMIIDYYDYEQPVIYNTPPKKRNSSNIQEKKDRSEEYKKRNIYKTKNKIIRLANHNFSIGDKFLTLTFDDYQDFDIKNIDQSNQRYTLFIRKLKKRFPNLKYLTRLQFQDKNDRGAVHYHIICNLPFVHYSDLTNLWGHGSIDIERIDSLQKLGPYIAKYLTRDLNDKRLDNHRAFFYSKKY